MNSKLLFLLVFLISSNLFAQHEEEYDTLCIKVKPITTTRLVLYSAVGAQQKYVSYVDAIDGNFKLPIPKNLNNGMYRLVFDQATMNYIDFLYVGKEVDFQFNPTDSNQPPVFKNSPENTMYYSKLEEFSMYQHQLDGFQVAFFGEEDLYKKKQLNKSYTKLYKEFHHKLTFFEKNEKSSLIKDLVRASIQVKPKQLMSDMEYLPYIKMHYFDHVDFDNLNLVNSSVLIDKVMDFVFYLTVSDDPNIQNIMYKQAVKNVLQRIDNNKIKRGFIQALVQSFAKEENTVVADYIFSDFYDKLPIKLQDSRYKEGMIQELRTAIGRPAPNFGWKEKDSIVKLSELKDYDNYIIVFWSSTCPHCLVAMPKLYEYAKDMKNIKVILVGLETMESKGSWKSETYYYPEFTHVLALGKWENPIPRSYNVTSTPFYFILDKDKMILDKPYEFLDIKVFFNGLKN